MNLSKTTSSRPPTFIIALGIPDARRAMGEATIVAAAMHRASNLVSAPAPARTPFHVIRSSAEILAFCRENNSYGSVIALAMDYVDDEAFVALMDRERREEEQQYPSDRSPLVDAEEYMQLFAWDAAFNHVGLSARMNLSKLEFWHWLIGDDEVVSWCRAPDAHVGYGAPILRKICLKHGWPVWDATVQQVRMQSGLWCRTSCDACARAEKQMQV